jgi:hypothetical protein
MNLLLQNCTLRELAEFNGAMTKIKIARLSLLLACLVFLGMVLTVHPADGHPVSKGPGYLTVGVLFLFALIMPYIAGARPWLILRNVSLQVRVGENGIELSGDAQVINHSWDFYRQMQETRSLYILIGPNPDKSFFFPKRAFSDDQQRGSFVALVKQHLP